MFRQKAPVVQTPRGSFRPMTEEEEPQCPELSRTDTLKMIKWMFDWEMEGLARGWSTYGFGRLQKALKRNMPTEEGGEAVEPPREEPQPKKQKTENAQ